MSLFRKWTQYSRHYGTFHAACAYLGRHSPTFWRVFGPRVTAPFLHQWMSRTGERLLNLGGGGNVAPHWLTADIDPRSDVYVDLTKPLPFPSSSLDGIFMEEAIEHIPASNAASLAMECFRCLKPGKPTRISTPDLLWFLALVNSAEELPDGLLQEMATAQLGTGIAGNHELRVAAVNSIFRDHGHVFIWDFAALSGLFARAGFQHVYRSSYKDFGSQLGRYDSHADRFNHPPGMSLYIEAVK